MSLLAQLESDLDAIVDATSDGQIVSSTESDGSRVAFSSPKVSGVTPIDLAETRSEFLDLYDRAVAKLGGDPLDDDIFSQMLLFLQPSTRVRANFWALRKNL